MIVIILLSDVWEGVKKHFSGETDIRWGLFHKAELCYWIRRSHHYIRLSVR